MPLDWGRPLQNRRNAGHCPEPRRLRQLERQIRSMAGRNRGRTDIEQAMADLLDTSGFYYEEQYSVGPYRVDFFLPYFDLCIETDGVYWHSSPESEEKEYWRDRFLQDEGLRVLHIRIDTWKDFPSLIQLQRLIQKAVA